MHWGMDTSFWCPSSSSPWNCSFAQCPLGRNSDRATLNDDKERVKSEHISGKKASLFQINKLTLSTLFKSKLFDYFCLERQGLRDLSNKNSFYIDKPNSWSLVRKFREKKKKHDFKQYLRIRIGEVSKHSHVNEWVRRH